MSAPSTVDHLLLLSSRRPRVGLGLALALTALFALPLASGWLRQDVRIEKVFPERDPRLADYQRFRDLFGRDDETAYVLLELPHDVLAPASLARIHSLTEALAAHPLVDARELISLSSAPFVRTRADGVLDVGSLFQPERAAEWDAERMAALLADHPVFARRLLSPDRRLAAFLIPLRPMQRAERTVAVRRAFAGAVRAFFAEHLQPGERAWFDGFAITYDGVLTLLERDVALFYPLALVLILATLGVSLRRARATLLCVATLIAAVIWTLGSMALLDVPLNFVSASALPVMVLVCCVGDAVHLIARAQQLGAAGLAPRAAIEEAVREVGRACFFTSVTTAAGFASLSVSQVEVVRELGRPTALGVMYAYVLTFLVIPPLLARAADGAGAAAPGRRLQGLLEALARELAARPGRIVLAFAAAVGLALSLAPHVNRENRLLQDFDPDQEILATRLFFEERMGGIAPLELLLDAGSPGAAMRPEVIHGLQRLTESLRSERFRAQGVLFALALPDYLADAAWTLEDRRPALKGALPHDERALHQLRFVYELAGTDPTRSTLDVPDAPQVLRLQLRVKNLETTPFFALVEAVRAEAERHLPPGVTVTVTGNTLMSQAIHQSLVQDMFGSFGLAFVSVGFLVLLAFRSVSLALLGMIPNLVPLALVLGAMTVLDVPLTMTTAIVFSVVFGLSVDDTIHFVAAFSHNRAQGVADPIGTTIRRSGLSLILTSAVLVAGFAVLALSQFKTNRNFGLLTALTVVFALAGDLLLLPALLHLARRREAR